MTCDGVASRPGRVQNTRSRLMLLYRNRDTLPQLWSSRNQGFISFQLRQVSPAPIFTWPYVVMTISTLPTYTVRRLCRDIVMSQMWTRPHASFWIYVWENHVIIKARSGFQNAFRPQENAKRFQTYSNSSGLISVFEKLRFRGRFDWQ